jgi:hypothetical protein
MGSRVAVVVGVGVYVIEAGFLKVYAIVEVTYPV